MKRLIQSLKLTIAALTLVLGTSNVVDAQTDFKVSLANGSVVTMSIDNNEIDWTDVLDNGEMKQRTVQLNQIEQLVLSDSPASKQVAEIRTLLSKLEGTDYLGRQEAEDKLADPKIGGRFKSLIESQAQHEKLEVRYRVARILDKLGDNYEESTSEFDVLKLENGEMLMGDAGSLDLQANFRDASIRLNREDISLIQKPKPAEPKSGPSQPVEVRLFHDHRDAFYQAGQTVIDFNQTPNGVDLPSKSDVSDVYVPMGLRMSTPKVGYIGISGYGFKFSGLPATGNSICVIETSGNYSKRFRGTLELKFCVPGQPSVPAGVHEIGLFIARVNHSRDLILEAYNAEGQLLACVESTDRPCVFSGVKSSEPIAKVRVLSNPHLFRVDRSIDDDFAVDSICFTPPVPVSGSTQKERSLVLLSNGDRISTNELSVLDSESVEAKFDGQVAKFNFQEVSTIHFGAKAEQEKPKPAAPENLKWMVGLDERSQLLVKPGSPFKSLRFDKLNLTKDNINAFWIANNVLRLPEADDFQNGKNVLVFPTCRIAGDVKFSDTGYRWGEDAKKLEQPLFSGKENQDDEDPTPQFKEIVYAKAWPENIPSVWLNPPKTASSKAGLIRTVSGEQFQLGDGATFKLDSLTSRGATISANGQSVTIPLDELESVSFPK